MKKLSSKHICLLLYVVVLVLIACYTNIRNDTSDVYKPTHEDARRATVDAWEKIIGPITTSCYNFTKETSITEVESLPDSCKAPPGKMVIGCYFTKNNAIMILNTLTIYIKADVVVHEFIHAISFCMIGYTDIKHENIRFWDEFGQNTVEVWGCSNL